MFLCGGNTRKCNQTVEVNEKKSEEDKNIEDGRNKWFVFGASIL